MTTHYQASLLDAAPSTGPTLDGLTGVERTFLSRGAWVDVLPGWVTGSDEVFERLVETVPWYAEKRQMYERLVDVPRLLSWYGERDPLPDPLLERARNALSEHYLADLGEPFRTAGLCYYRDGRDSVAWHGDTIGRSRHEDTLVAIVSFGAARRLMLRPRLGGESLSFPLGHGDLLVMGGSCQRTWEHAIPKTSRDVGPESACSSGPAACADLDAHRHRETRANVRIPGENRRQLATQRLAPVATRAARVAMAGAPTVCEAWRAQDVCVAGPTGWETS